MDHALLKHLHVTTVAVSIFGFTLRSMLMLRGSQLLRQRWMRTWPHVIDTLLLVSGVWMATNLNLNPLATPWLGAKIVALLAYIALGFIALRLGKTHRRRVIAMLGALACFAYMIGVATTRSVIPL